MAVSVFSESEVSVSFGVGVVSSGGGVGLLGVGGDVCFHPGRDGWDGRRGKRFFGVLSS